MNSISNIEIINFEEFNQDEKSLDLEKNMNINYMKNFLIEKYDSEYSEGNEINGYDSSCNMSMCSEMNSNFSNLNMSMNDSFNNSNVGDFTASSENLKISSNLNDSFSNLEKVSNNSFSFLRRTNKFKLNNDSDCNMSNISYNSTASKYFPCSFDGCEKVYKSKENLTLHFKNIHLKEKPYSCKFCNSQFSHRNGIFRITLIFSFICLKLKKTKIAKFIK